MLCPSEVWAGRNGERMTSSKRGIVARQAKAMGDLRRWNGIGRAQSAHVERKSVAEQFSPPGFIARLVNNGIVARPCGMIGKHPGVGTTLRIKQERCKLYTAS